MKKEWHTPKLTRFTQANEDYEALNNILIAQAGEMEIVIQQQAERIRDLEAENAALKVDIEAYKAILEKCGIYIRKETNINPSTGEHEWLHRER